MSTPAVLLVVFKRPEITARVFEAIRQARPERLYLAADGPRPNVPGEAELCRQTLEIVSHVDWPCEVQRFFRTQNVGVRREISTAITWFFERESEGIILEDDCLPHPDFFRFAGELLEKYRDEPRVVQISGSNFQPGRRGEASYFFSRYNHVWGWATWRRAWSRYRTDLQGLDSFFRAADRAAFWFGPHERKYWNKMLGRTARGEINSWAYRWQYSVWATGGVCLYPEMNLVSNIGFVAGATNTLNRDGKKADRALAPLGEMVHPEFVLLNRAADRWTFRHLYWGTRTSRFVARVRKVLKLMGVGR